MDYRPSPHLRHFQNDKSQRPFIFPLSFSFPVSLPLPLSLPPLLLISWALAFNCKRLQEHSRTVARRGSFINIYMHMKQANSKLSVSSWTLRPHCVYIYMQEPVCVAVVCLWIYSMCVCRTVPVFMCVPVFHFGTNRLTLRCPRPPEPPVMYQRPRVVFSHQDLIVSRTSGSLSSRLNRTLRPGVCGGGGSKSANKCGAWQSRLSRSWYPAGGRSRRRLILHT